MGKNFKSSTFIFELATLKNTASTGLCSLFLALLVLFSGCGEHFRQEDYNYTEVVLSRGKEFRSNIASRLSAPSNLADDVFQPLALGGGVMIFAISTNDMRRRGQFFLTNAEAGTTTGWILPNDSYYFSAIGFGSSGLASGQCGRAKGDSGNEGDTIKLSGGKKSVLLATTSLNCERSPFTDSTDAQINLTFCDGGDVLGALGSTQYCTAVEINGQINQSADSIKIGFYSRDDFGPGDLPQTAPPNLISGCLPVTTSSGSVTVPVIPIGVLNNERKIAIGTTIAVYSDTNCQNLVTTYAFPSGLAFAGNTTAFPTTIKNDQLANGRAKWVKSTNQGRLLVN